MRTLNLIFLLIYLSKESTVQWVTVNYQKPNIIEEELSPGDTIEITFNQQNSHSFLINVGKLKFYLNLQIGQNKYHSTTKGLHALGDSGKAYYTALESGLHKIFIWSTSSSYCMHIVAKGKQKHILSRPISPSPFVFIETDPNEKMTVHSDQLVSGTFVIPFIDSEFKEYGPLQKEFTIQVDLLVRVQSANRGEVNVNIDSNGNIEYDYCDIDESDIALSSKPFTYYNDEKKNMMDGFYDPSVDPPPDDSSSDSGASSSSGSSSSSGASSDSGSCSDSGSTKTDSNDNQNPDKEPESDEPEEDDGLSTGAWAGIGTAIAAGIGGVAGTAVGVYKKMKKAAGGQSENEDDGGKIVNKNHNENNINLHINISSDALKNGAKIEAAPTKEEL